MSERPHHRRPATFKLDDPGVVVMDPHDTSRPSRGTVQITPEADPALLPVPTDAPLVPVQRGFRWGTLFWGALGGLILLGAGLGVTHWSRICLRAARASACSDWRSPSPRRWP
jgi:putative membrane protein